MPASVFDILEAVRSRPAMYVGGSDADRAGQLRTLEVLLQGYAMAVNQHGLRDAVADFNRDFGSYLYRRFGWSMSTGPVAAILDVEADGDAAWERYWHLVDDFKREVAVAR